MWTSDNMLGLVFNGEIYNHADIRKELTSLGHVFKTDHSDTETLLHGYYEWGEGIVPKLNGMWAFAVYDKRKKQIFLSRDRFGKKPLFYSFQKGVFAFSSELSSLIQHPEIQASISKRSLKKYFAYGYIPSPNSLYEQIYKLPGGYNMLFNLRDNAIKIKKYWDFVIEPFEKTPKNPEKVWGEELMSLLNAAVKRRLIADVPLGVFLSGGIDSSLITAFASRYFPIGGLKTFSIGFNEESFDESKYFNKVSSFFETEHHTEVFSLDKAKMLMGEVMSNLDEPMGDSSLLPTYMLCRETRKHVTVAIGGDGADELFAGYDPFKALALAELYSKIVPKPIHQVILMLASKMPTSHVNMSLDFKIKRALRGLLYQEKIWLPVWGGALSPHEMDDIFNEPTDAEDIYSEAIECWDNTKQLNIVDKTLAFYTKLYLQDDILVKIDRASMMNSLEVRAPFLDNELVDFVRKIPWQFKFRGNTTKYILKSAAMGILPPEITSRKKKGFGIPVGKWFCEDDFLNIEDINLKYIRNIGSYSAAHKHGKADNRLFLYNCAQLNAFYEMRI